MVLGAEAGGLLSEPPQRRTTLVPEYSGGHREDNHIFNRLGSPFCAEWDGRSPVCFGIRKAWVQSSASPLTPLTLYPFLRLLLFFHSFIHSIHVPSAPSFGYYRKLWEHKGIEKVFCTFRELGPGGGYGPLGGRPHNGVLISGLQVLVA